jgi:hypothetical protein
MNNYKIARESGVSETSNCNISWQMKEPIVSQGCCLAVINIVFFVFFYFLATLTQGM